MNSIREKYIAGSLYKEGDIVVDKTTESIYEIISLGTNYLVVINEQGIESRLWLTNIINANSLREDFDALRRKRSSSNQIAYVGFKTKYFTKEIYDCFKPLLKENHDKFLLLSLIRSTDEILKELNNTSSNKIKSLIERTEKYLIKLDKLDEHHYRQEWI